MEPGDKMIRRINEPVFTKLDMIRFARYLSAGKQSESELKQLFDNWTMDRFKWIEG